MSFKEDRRRWALRSPKFSPRAKIICAFLGAELIVLIGLLLQLLSLKSSIRTVMKGTAGRHVNLVGDTYGKKISELQQVFKGGSNSQRLMQSGSLRMLSVEP